MSVKRTISAALAGAAVLAGGVLTAIPAQAAASDACPLGYACMWANSDYTTSVGLFSRSEVARIQFARYISNTGTVKYMGTSISGNDNASSVMNHGRYSAVVFYQHINGGGWGLQVDRGKAYRFNGGRYDNNISSAYFAGY